MLKLHLVNLFSPVGKLYFTFRNFFLFLLWAKLSQYLLDRFSRSFHPMEGICVNFLNLVQFFKIPQGMLPWQPILFCTGLVRSEPKYLRIRWTNFHNLCTVWQMIKPNFFFRYLKGCCHGNQFSGKNGAKLPTSCTYRSVIPKRNGILPCEYTH